MPVEFIQYPPLADTGVSGDTLFVVAEILLIQQDN